ncbi:MAG: tetratricopeptide repeat protein [Bacteroidaceae bacterium]|nr:tetratricopeptide repeat protein [Bacteroidaceae bacterium]
MRKTKGIYTLPPLRGRVGVGLFFLLFFVVAHAQQQEETTSADNTYAEMTIEQQFDKASEYMSNEKWQAAKNIYDSILRISPENLRALYFRAYANERLFHLGLARADYDAILKKEPVNYHALSGRAILNQKDSHNTEALDDANLLVEQYPDSVNAWVIRANIEEELGQLSLAEFDYLQANNLNTSNKDYILHAIDLQLRQKKKSDAKRNLNALVKAGVPKNSLLHYFKRVNLRNP